VLSGRPITGFQDILPPASPTAPSNFWARALDRIKPVWFPLLAACLSFGLLQIEGIERSFLGAPDREMLQTAFKLRDGVARGSGDPVLWLDIDYETLMAGNVDAVAAPGSTAKSGDEHGPVPYVPRTVIAAALDYARSADASLVLLDVDVGWNTRDLEGQAALMAALDRWAGDPRAPLLLLAREVLALPPGPTLPASPLDTVISAAPNITAATVSNLSAGGGVREFVAGQCMIGPDGQNLFVPSAVTYAMAAQRQARQASGPTPSQTPNQTSLAEPAAIVRQVKADTKALAQACQQARPAFLPPVQAAGLISWHIGFSYPGTIKAAPVAAHWPHIKRCGLSAPPPSASRISVADILASPASASTEPLCGRLVIIGADNPIQQDRAATPIGLLPGPIILANAMRGHFDTGPIMRTGGGWVRLCLQIGLLVLTVIAVVWAFQWVSRLRLSLKARQPASVLTKALLFITHPLCFKFVVAFVTFGIGALVTAWSLNLGFWGLLSAPAYFAALFEAWQQINSEKAPTPASDVAPSCSNPEEFEDGQHI
jgi:CHASE2 domain